MSSSATPLLLSALMTDVIAEAARSRVSWAVLACTFTPALIAARSGLTCAVPCPQTLMPVCCDETGRTETAPARATFANPNVIAMMVSTAKTATSASSSRDVPDDRDMYPLPGEKPLNDNLSVCARRYDDKRTPKVPGRQCECEALPRRDGSEHEIVAHGGEGAIHRPAIGRDARLTPLERYNQRRLDA